MKIENNDFLNEKLAEFKRQAIEKARLEELKRKKDTDETQALLSKAQERMLKFCTPARMEDYANWLKGYMAAGNEPTHYYHYSFSRVADRFYLGLEDFELVPLYGANSVSIIVPSGIAVSGEVPGHNNLYFEEGYRTLGFENSPAIVPVYSDIKF